MGRLFRITAYKAALLCMLHVQTAGAAEKHETFPVPGILIQSDSKGRIVELKISQGQNDNNTSAAVHFVYLPSNGAELEEVPVFSQGKRTSTNNFQTPDCSVSRVLVRVSALSKGVQPILFVAERVEAKGLDIPVQSSPQIQLIREFTLKSNDGFVPGRATYFFEEVSSFKSQAVCDVGAVDREIEKFADANLPH